MPRSIPLILTLLFLGVAHATHAADQLPSAEFPPQDASLAGFVNQGAEKTRAAELLRRESPDADTIRALARAHDVQGLLQSLRTIVDRYPERIVIAFENVVDGFALVPFTNTMPAAEYEERLRKILADARAALALRPREEQARGERVLMGLDPYELAPRIVELTRSASLPGGTMFERARALITREQFDPAVQELTRMLARYPSSPLASEGRALLHRAQVEQALEIADANRPGGDEVKAMQMVEATARAPHDFGVTAAKITRASLLLKRRQQADAAKTLSDALAEWHQRQPVRAPSTGLEEDVAAIRQVVFLPRGGGLYGGGDWNGFTWPTAAPPFLILQADVPVSLHDGEPVRITLTQQLPDAGRLLFFDTGQIALLRKILVKLGGTRRREPQSVMDTPNQPVGDSMQILALWNQFFPARPGHWGGWVLASYPEITHIQFTNAERTKALARVTIGYAGATVELEKEGGRWIARRLTNQWVT